MYESDAGNIPDILCGLLLNIGHYVRMVRKRISPTHNSIVSAKPSDHVTTMMHDEALVHYLIHETFNNGRFYLLTINPLRNQAACHLLDISDQSLLYWYVISQSE